MLFADVRHYFPDRGIWDLENSGQHATWFAARSDDPAENLSRVNLYPEGFYFPAGGASVHHLAAPGEMTLARLSRLNGRYRMQITRGAFEQYDAETNEALMRQSTYHWPHAFTRLAAERGDVPRAIRRQPHPRRAGRHRRRARGGGGAGRRTAKTYPCTR